MAPASPDVAAASARILPGWLLPVLLVAFAATAVLGMAQAAPFGWDESVYGLLARHWVEGTPASGWDIHRPPALSALGVLPVLLGGQDWQLRAVGLAFGVGLVAATWFTARSMGGPRAGLLAAAVVAGSTPIAVDAGLFLNDIPAAATLVLGVAVLWWAVERPGPVAWGLLWLAPIAAAAFYLRYGAAVPIAGLALAAFLAWPVRLAAAWPKVLATAALLAVLLVPHLAFSLAQTGSPLGILLTGQAAAGPSATGPSAPGDGLLEYLDAFPAPLAGLLPAAFMVLGLGGWSHRLVAAVAHRSMSRRTRALTLLVVAAVFQVVVLGLTIHAEPRYVYLAVVLLVIGGSLVLTDAARARGRLGAAVLAVAGLAAAVALAVNLAAVPLEMRDRAHDGGWERETARRIAEEAPGGDCGVVVYTVPQTSWYSRCGAVNFGDGRSADADARLDADRRFLVIRTDGVAQPDEDVLADYLERAAPEPVIVVDRADGTPAARVYRLER
jgi:4-amino-4-deoxy-L-arabinose transferase-like glycosyltransferase